MDLTPAQVEKLEAILKAGFRFVTIERAERYLGVEREGFVALLEPAGGTLRLFGQAGYLIGEGIGMLVERREGKCFVWHDHCLPATSEMLAAYDKFRRELEQILGAESVILKTES